MNKCKCCGSEKLQLLIDFGMQPVAHNLLDYKEQEDTYKHPLCLHYCENCGFVQINNPIAPDKLYTKYNYCFSAWKKQPQIPAEMELLDRYIINKNINILEVGCNDGVFLTPLYESGYTNIVGIEANPYAAKEAMRRGFDVLTAMFDKHSAEKIKEQYNGFDMVVMRQVLEHIPDLDEFFEAIDLILNGEQLLLIEIPDFGEALKYGDCSTIWEEHPNYFTYDVLEFMLSTKGYMIIEKDFYDFSGGAICVLAKKMKNQVSYKPNNMQQYESFANVVNNYASKLKDALNNMRKKGVKVFLYGTGARACTLINGLGIGEYIDCAVDDQKEKQGHYMPGCHLPILSLANSCGITGNKCYLLAVNHENEDAISKKIMAMDNSNDIKIISLFAPNNIFMEVEKISG